jgi:hypothetical protein
LHQREAFGDPLLGHRRRLIAAGLTAFAIGYALFLREHSPISPIQDRSTEALLPDFEAN